MRFLNTALVIVENKCLNGFVDLVSKNVSLAFNKNAYENRK